MSAEATIDQLLHEVVRQEASDLHIQVGLPPMVRVHGTVRPVTEGARPLDAERVKQIVGEVLVDPQAFEELRADRDVDLAYAIEGLARFRVNVFVARGYPAMVMRRIPEIIPQFHELNLPPAMDAICNLQRGLVLVTGPTGSGKSTSLAAMIRLINERRNGTILTIEDPIEFVHSPIRSVIRQREIGRDALSFPRALRAALRQDPDVILVGEMRDKETVEIALTAAETGHLVFSTLHTRSAEATVSRVIDVFEAGQQSQIRTQLSTSLAAVMTQALLPRIDTPGRAAAFEVLIGDDAVRNMIRENKLPQIRSHIQTQMTKGMITMDRSLAELVLSGRVDVAEAAKYVQDAGEFEKLLSGQPLGRPTAAGAMPTDGGGMRMG